MSANTASAYTQTEALTGATAHACRQAANAQDAINLRAVVRSFDRQLDALHAQDIYGDQLASHPAVLAFVSKLASLTRLNVGSRETDALLAVMSVADNSATVLKYEVIPL